MAPTFEDFIQSPQFTFFVGQEGKPIVVHAAAIAATSPQLDALINGGMEESATKCARIEDVKVEDFIRFCEYAYRGDYTTPPWEQVMPEPSSTSSMGQQNWSDDSWGVTAFEIGMKSKKAKKGKKAKVFPVIEVSECDLETIKPDPEMCEPVLDVISAEPEASYKAAPISRTPLRTRFDNRNYLDGGGTKAQILQDFESKPNTAVDQNFTPVLLAHARLYCFAHVRLIEPLRGLTLNKLHTTLVSFKLFTRRVGDILELARFAYSNPDLPNRRDNGTIDDLRKLVIEYIVCEIDTIGKSEEFVKCIEEASEFAGDFWRMARDYMV